RCLSSRGRWSLTFRSNHSVWRAVKARPTTSKVRPTPQEPRTRARSWLFAFTLVPMRASLIALFLAATAAAATAQTTTPQTPGASPAPLPAPASGQNVVSPPPLGRVFAAEQGLIFNAIRPDKVMDFETV